ncbi:hypothetical protein ACTI_61610 [Actinoplanes sp. OR16]|uniref:hypothetical protein n=1 Tax=Actinoplanes sp. OR16 TaxID=946334 RepID=UPI000F72077D|nr:hypothetical protein [Actinoplanes sp. OR16]BBH69476.1 hypothetical protein ACTI_61610 [Actinoplanes sp. OR16]
MRVRYGFAVLVFLLMAWSGAGLAGADSPGLPLAFLIGGVAGAAGSIAAMLGRRRLARTVMLAGAATAAVAGFAFAPGGVDRGFVIGAAVLVAGLLALFALVSTPRSTTGRGETGRS